MTKTIAAKQVATLMSQIATERRCKIIRVLLDAKEPVASSMIATITGTSEAATSFNLSVLLNAGVVTKIPSGRWGFYILNESILSIISEFFTPQETDNEGQRFTEE